MPIASLARTVPRRTAAAIGLAAAVVLIVDLQHPPYWPSAALAGLTLAMVVLCFAAILATYHRALEEASRAHGTLATETREGRAALRDAQERLRHAFEDAPIGQAIVAMDGRWLEVNTALCALLGYSREELLERRMQELTHPDDTAAQLPALEEFRAGTRDAYQGEKRYFRADGEQVWVQINVSSVRLDGAPDYLVAQVQDITARRRWESQVRAAEQRWGLVFDEAPIGIALVALDGRRLRVNRAYCEMFGYQAETLVGAEVVAMVHPDDVDEHRAVLRRALAGESSVPRETRRLGTGARVVWVQARSTLVRDDDGLPLYFISQLVDVTERKRADAELVTAQEERVALAQRLRQVERLDTVGKLASGTAHDFNNLLAVISTYAALLADDVQDERLRADVEQIRNAARSAAALIRQLLVFGGRDVAGEEAVDLNGLVRSTADLLRRTLSERTTLDAQLDEHLHPVVAGRTQLEQLLVNLIVNARDALAHGGLLEIQTANIELAAGTVPGLEAGPYVRLSVRDTGCGMDADAVRYSFEPFFTTKPHGVGTGLGLTTVYGIATTAGGTVQLDSALGHGTTVTVLLPAVPSAVPVLDALELAVISVPAAG